MEMLLQTLIWLLLAVGTGSFVTASVLMFQERRALAGAGEEAVKEPAPERVSRSILPAQTTQARARPTPPIVQGRSAGLQTFSVEGEDDEEAPTEILSAEKVAELLGPARTV